MVVKEEGKMIKLLKMPFFELFQNTLTFKEQEHIWRGPLLCQLFTSWYLCYGPSCGSIQILCMKEESVGTT